jgi:hypothetical protein
VNIFGIQEPLGPSPYSNIHIGHTPDGEELCMVFYATIRFLLNQDNADLRMRDPVWVKWCASMCDALEQADND